MKKRMLCLLLSIMIVSQLIQVTEIYSTTTGLTSDPWNGNIDMTWYRPDVDNFILYTPEQLAGFASLVNSGTDLFYGKTIRLGADIVMNPPGTFTRKWIPIGLDETKAFLGTFIGDGHVIEGLYVNDIFPFCGLFGVTGPDAVIVNVGLKGSRIVGSRFCTAGIVAYNHGLVADCWNIGEISVVNLVGGIVGRNKGYITRCWSDGNIFGMDYTGGICGEVPYDSGTITNSYNYASIQGGNYIGGIVGASNSYIGNCFNSGEIIGLNGTGGIVGSQINSNIENCFNNGGIAGFNFTGGIVGQASDVNIAGCYVIADIIGVGGVGGIAGAFNYSSALSCYFSGNILASLPYGPIAEKLRHLHFCQLIITQHISLVIPDTD